MNNPHKYICCLLLTTVTLLIGCKEDKATDNADELRVNCPHPCLIVNMGNYSESNGSICSVKEGQGIQQNLFSKVNGYKLRSIIESAAFYNNYILLMCGNEDKVEILDATTYKEVCKAITGINLPRYADIFGNYAYVTCVNPSWKDTIGQITKIDLDSKTVVNKITVNGNPEGIKNANGLLYVASDNGMYIIDPTTDAVSNYISLPDSLKYATPRYFVTDSKGRILMSYAKYDQNGNGYNCGLAVYTPGATAFDKTISLPNMCGDAYIDISPDGNTLYYLSADDIISGQNPEAKTCIYTVNLNTDTPTSTPLCTGYGFYGINVDPYTGNIYTANVNGFITNSMVYIYDCKGNLLQNSLMAGVGACRFYFR